MRIVLLLLLNFDYVFIRADESPVEKVKLVVKHSGRFINTLVEGLQVILVNSSKVNLEPNRKFAQIEFYILFNFCCSYKLERWNSLSMLSCDLSVQVYT